MHYRNLDRLLKTEYDAEAAFLTLYMGCLLYTSSTAPSELIRCAGNLSRVLRRIIRDGGDYTELLEEHNRTLSKLVFASSYFDEKFRFFASRENNSVKAEILCLDPSGVLSAMLSAARAVVLFSATLSPIEYFCEVTGLEGAKTLELQSPYERDNLCLLYTSGTSDDDKPFRMPVEDVYKFTEGGDDRRIVAGMCESGTLRAGDDIIFYPSGKTTCLLYTSRCV